MVIAIDLIGSSRNTNLFVHSLRIDFGKMMGLEPKNLHSSIPVPSVQELASLQLEAEPSRYIRDDMDSIISTVPSDNTLRVPLIDMTKLVDSESQETASKASCCMQRRGIFQLINHGVSDESLRNMNKQTQEFFDLPLKEKKRWAQKPGSLEGYGQAFVTSEEQKLDWNDMFFLKALPIEDRNLEIWPENPPKFRYSQDMRQIAVALIRFRAMGLEIETRELCAAYEEGLYQIRMNYYPPCPQPERVTGFTPHVDIPGFAMLLDCGDTPGLQVLRDGQWIFVKPLDGAVVVDMGQITEILSNGLYKAPEHRAVVNKSKERRSIVTFCYPNLSFKVGPAKELIKLGIPPLYKTVTVEEYLGCFFNRKLEVPFIDTLKI
ncbi:hypothetical protein SADUNF_Sadunf09G0015200 [Salix dunnii]|uniref:Fe2OG dioxygenase domain-containing protein n=1 Tax=Salix dunnii TaxID=1413687 RepID=A0A835MQK6_9ROSI|nr:hypothetical protein SADUNF_Sadunf09G0015200 [Salix dunnii]